MGVQGIPVEAGFGDRPFVPFFGTADIADAISDPANAETLASAAMILSSLGLVRTLETVDLRPEVTRPTGPYGLRGVAERPVSSGEARVLDIDFVRAVALRPENHASLRPETDYLLGLQRSLLDRGLQIRTVGRPLREVGGGALESLEHFREHRMVNVAPSFQPDGHKKPGGLSRLMKGVGTDRAVWVTREGGFPEAGLAVDGVLTAVLIGGNSEKVKLHVAGNSKVPPTNGMNARPESLFGVGGTVLHVVGRPASGIMGTTIKQHHRGKIK